MGGGGLSPCCCAAHAAALLSNLSPDPWAPPHPPPLIPCACACACTCACACLCPDPRRTRLAPPPSPATAPFGWASPSCRSWPRGGAPSSAAQRSTEQSRAALGAAEAMHRLGVLGWLPQGGGLAHGWLAVAASHGPGLLIYLPPSPPGQTPKTHTHTHTTTATPPPSAIPHPQAQIFTVGHNADQMMLSLWGILTWSE